MNSNGVKILTKRMTFLFAAVCGIAVANLYYNQPLLAEIANYFQTSQQNAGLISTFTQLGYALGIFLFVPLGDIRDKRNIILLLIGLATVALLGISLSPNLLFLYGASFVLGLTNVSSQILIPLSTELTSAEERGKVVGTIVSGLLIGILSARTVSGTIGYLFGWKAMFVIAAIAMFIILVILFFKLPATKCHVEMKYHELLRSVLLIIAKYPLLRQAASSGALLFCAFSVFWTTMAFKLQLSPFYMNSSQIGLFGLIGVVGALGSSFIGRQNDRHNPNTLIKICIIISILSYTVFIMFSSNIIGIIIGVILLDFGIQGAQVSNQTKIYSISSHERSRLNTVFVVSNFLGAATGSLLGSYIWNIYEWNGVCILGCIMLILALCINLF